MVGGTAGFWRLSLVGDICDDCPFVRLVRDICDDRPFVGCRRGSRAWWPLCSHGLYVAYVTHSCVVVPPYTVWCIVDFVTTSRVGKGLNMPLHVDFCLDFLFWEEAQWALGWGVGGGVVDP